MRFLPSSLILIRPLGLWTQAFQFGILITFINNFCLIIYVNSNSVCVFCKIIFSNKSDLLHVTILLLPTSWKYGLCPGSTVVKHFNNPKIKDLNPAFVVVFTTLHFLRNLRMLPSVTRKPFSLVYCNTLVIGSICRLRRKWSVVLGESKMVKSWKNSQTRNVSKNPLLNPASTFSRKKMVSIRVTNLAKNSPFGLLLYGQFNFFLHFHLKHGLLKVF